MNADNTEYWSLFENRPAKERTSSAAADKTQPERDRADEWSRSSRRAIDRTAATERTIC